MPETDCMARSEKATVKARKTNSSAPKTAKAAPKPRAITEKAGKIARLASVEAVREPSKVAARPSWDTYFLRIAQLVATRATCLRRTVGAVIVRDKRILATGYNGAPNGVPHCFELPGGCLREAMHIPSGQRQELCRGLHAEQNAILQASAFGVSLKGSEIYVTHQPCVTCAKMLINAGITRVVFIGSYPDELALEMLREGNIKLERIGVD